MGVVFWAATAGGFQIAAEETQIAAEETRPVSDPAVAKLLASIRDRQKLPALWGGVVQGDRMVAAAVVGRRRHNHETPATLDDKLHLGSCTKAMTATLLAMLVEEGKLDWESTLGEVFAASKDRLHEDFRSVTLWQLATHTAGAAPNGQWWNLGKDLSTTEQRRALLESLFSKPPVHRPGSEFLYSNAGYAIAGLMAETVTSESWESLMKKRLFKPLGMSSAGFGAPGAKKQLDQPWGHRSVAGHWLAQQGDNAPALGPAGTVHASLGDWGKFISLHLAAARGSPRLLKRESFARLHTPPTGRDYAAGWGLLERPWGGGQVMTHSGSNTLWFAVVWMAPKRNFAVLAVTNAGGDEAAEACDKAASALIRHYLDGRSAR